MSGSATGRILAFIIAAPLIVICCAGKAALTGAAFFGTVGLLTGQQVLTIVLVTILGSIVFLTASTVLQARRTRDALEEENQIERQTL